MLPYIYIEYMDLMGRIYLISLLFCRSSFGIKTQDQSLVASDRSHRCGRPPQKPPAVSSRASQLAGWTMGPIWVCLKMSAKPLNPMVLLIIIPFLNGYFIGNIPNIFRQTHMGCSNFSPWFVAKKPPLPTTKNSNCQGTWSHRTSSVSRR